MKPLLSYWSFEWSPAFVLALLLTFYLVLRPEKTGRLFFFLAVVLFALCYFSPLHVLSTQYLFAAHMLVHVLLLLGVGPLLVLSLPPGGKQGKSFFSFLKKYPATAWLTGLGMMWFWHVPAVFNRAMPAMHANGFSLVALAETVSLVLAGVIFSAPVLHPGKNFRIDALSGVVYLFTACVGCSLLGLLITFAPAGTFHHFLSGHDSYSLNTFILHRWGIGKTVDQQAAGLIMWVPCCLFYVTGALYLLVQWFRQKEPAGKETTPVVSISAKP